jgi:hypothetical protein
LLNISVTLEQKKDPAAGTHAIAWQTVKDCQTYASQARGLAALASFGCKNNNIDSEKIFADSPTPKKII